MNKFSFYTFFVVAATLLLAPEVYAADQSGEAISGLALGSGLGIGIAALMLTASIIHGFETTVSRKISSFDGIFLQKLII